MLCDLQQIQQNECFYDVESGFEAWYLVDKTHSKSRGIGHNNATDTSINDTNSDNNIDTNVVNNENTTTSNIINTTTNTLTQHILCLKILTLTFNLVAKDQIKQHMVALLSDIKEVLVCFESLKDVKGVSLLYTFCKLLSK
jgi:hypothetical protein